MAPIDFKYLTRMDYAIVGSIITLLSLLVFMRDRKKWMKVDCIANGLCIVTLVNPRLFLNYAVKGHVSESHELLLRCASVLAISVAVSIFFALKSRDHTVQVSILNARLVAQMVLAIILFAGLARNGLDANQWFTKKILIALGAMDFCFYPLGFAYFLSRSTYFGKYFQQETWSTFHLRIDFFACLLWSLVDLAATQQSWHAVMNIYGVNADADPVNTYLLQACGGMALGLAFQSLEATGYMYARDRQNMFLTRIVMAALLFCIKFYYTMVVVWQPKMLVRSSILCSIFLANSVLGYMSLAKEADKQTCEQEEAHSPPKTSKLD